MMQHINSSPIKYANVKLVCLAVAAVFLAGCKSVGPDYERPQLPLPAQYGEAANQAQAQVSSTW